VAAVIALLITRARRLGRAMDEAIIRVGGASPRRRRHRVRALSATLDDLERSLGSAQRERARLAGAVHTAPFGVVVTNDAGVVVTSNPTAARFLGAGLGEAVAESRVRQAIETAILGRTAVDVEVEIHTPVRSVLEVTAIPLDFGVESVGAVAFISDVTEGRRVMAMRRDFIANVSHELKTPLAALAVLAETLADGVADEATMTSLARRVEKEAHRLAELVDDILDLSQAEAPEVVRSPVALGPIVDEVIAGIEPIARDRGVDLVVEPVPHEARVSGDRRQLTTMLANIVENGVKYSEPSGGTVARSTVTIRTEVSGERVRVAVEDTGIGIPDVHVERIFERFYRVDRGRSRESGGTGLGLSIVRHIARTHRGDVTVRSVEGEGSTFVVDLPLWSAG
jgi:two-component system, OmpR family, sensor histidine kinase SenX3